MQRPTRSPPECTAAASVTAMGKLKLDFVVEPRYVVKALDRSTWAAFAALVERNNGIFGGCWCMGFHPEQPWPEEVQERVPQKRAAKEQRVR
jgi:hypothetical protein